MVSQPHPARAADVPGARGCPGARARGRGAARRGL